jgi:hypothetical protein
MQLPDSGGIVDIRQFYEMPAGMLFDAHQKRTKQNAQMKKTEAPPGR